MEIDDIELMEKTLDGTHTSEKKAHPWRKCSWGKHLVREYTGHVPPSKKHPSGTDSIWHEHCANNPSKKDELSHAEIQYITATHFTGLSGSPTAGVLKFKGVNADGYDKEIRGWTQYWNDIFQPTILLDANLVKALIATESGFRPNPKENRIARGLMQIRNTTREYLADPKGELRNYLVRLSPAELLEASPNICAGIRWLFRKKETATGKLKREATWEEAIEDYKALLDNILNGDKYNPKPVEDLRKYYNLLQRKQE